MRLHISIRRMVAGFVLAMSFLGVLIFKQNLTLIDADQGTLEDIFYIPKAKNIKPFLLGHEAFLADLTWIRTVGYFADELFGRNQFRYLEGLLEFAIDLDPRFEKVYIWAGAILMYRGGRVTEEKILASTQILEKGWKRIQNDPVGWKHIPEYWMIPQMIGFNYAVELRDKKRGAPYIAATARIPGSPTIYKTWAATLLKKAGELEEGAEMLEAMLAVETLQAQLETVEGKGLKDKIRRRLQYYYARLYGKEGARKRLEMLEERIRLLLSEWKRDLNFVSFDLFLLLRTDSGSVDEEVLSDNWKAGFPLLSKLLAG